MPSAQLHLYGLPSCDTVRKARRWLEAQGVPFDFHPFAKTQDLDQRLADWVAIAGLDVILNPKSRNFKALDPDQQALLLEDSSAAIQAMAATPQLIKRPVLDCQSVTGARSVLTGFKQDQWEALLARLHT